MFSVKYGLSKMPKPRSRPATQGADPVFVVSPWHSRSDSNSKAGDPLASTDDYCVVHEVIIAPGNTKSPNVQVDQNSDQPPQGTESGWKTKRVDKSEPAGNLTIDITSLTASLGAVGPQPDGDPQVEPALGRPITTDDSQQSSTLEGTAYLATMPNQNITGIKLIWAHLRHYILQTKKVFLTY